MATRRQTKSVSAARDKEFGRVLSWQYGFNKFSKACRYVGVDHEHMIHML